MNDITIAVGKFKFRVKILIYESSWALCKEGRRKARVVIWWQPAGGIIRRSLEKWALLSGDVIWHDMPITRQEDTVIIHRAIPN